MLSLCIISSMHSKSIFTSLFNPTFLFLLLLLFGSPCLLIIKPCTCTKDLNVKCNKTEREALVTFKEGLTDPSDRLSSWVGDDCCEWRGVECDNQTGHVLKLDLRNPSQLNFLRATETELVVYKQSCLGGEINPSLLHLNYLIYLDLSFNDFGRTHIPEFLASLHNLRYLNLSSASFSGEIPPQIGNLSHLQYLDLYGESYSNFYIKKLHVENLRWLSGLSSLEHLNMGYVNLSKVGADWLQAVNMLPSLLELHLGGCELQSLPLSLPFVNFTSLLILDMSENEINSSIPYWLFNLTSLAKLDLSWNHFHGAIPGEILNLIFLEELDLSFNLNIEGQIPRFLGNLGRLKILDLSGNQLSGNLPDSLGRLKELRYLNLFANSFWGSIPESIGNLSSLQELDLSSNKMNGTIPQSFGHLSELVSLFLDSNSWDGVLTEAHFLNLTRLETLSVGYTSLPKSLHFNMSFGWIPPFSLKSIVLQNCQLGPKFPSWIQTQSELQYIILTNVGISDTVPGDWISKLSSQITYLDLSNNQIRGKLPQSLKFPKIDYIDLSSNFLEGSFPLWSANLTGLYLDQNLFSGPIPTNLGELMPFLECLYLSGNFLNGSIAPSILNLKFLETLSVGDNHLSGVLPDIWNDFQVLGVLDLANNSFYGNIPKSLGNLSQLEFLLLSDNQLEGELPVSLQNCKNLKSLDLGGNNLLGYIPLWIGEKLSSLEMLRLRSNSFIGELPPQLCHLSHLRILDLAENKFTGSIPKCLYNLTSLVYSNSTIVNSSHYQQTTMIVAKGREFEYGSTLDYLYSIDLSQNHLMGGIPEQITSLSALGTLNLSSNHLNGSIPERIGDLRWLETLDLSNNHLSGPIPESISSLTFLSHFNLSYNNLAGRIPSGNQLQTLDDNSIYEGNPSLCGVPLPNKCPDDDEDPYNGQTSNENGDEDDSELMQWFRISFGPGFVVGFWCVCGTLLVKTTWRHSYFQFIDGIRDWIGLMITSIMASLQRRMGLSERY